MPQPTVLHPPATGRSRQFTLQSWPISDSLCLGNRTPWNKTGPAQFFHSNALSVHIYTGWTHSPNCHHSAQITPVTISTLSLCLRVPAGAVCNRANSHILVARQTHSTGESHPNILKTIICYLITPLYNTSYIMVSFLSLANWSRIKGTNMVPFGVIEPNAHSSELAGLALKWHAHWFK